MNPTDKITPPDSPFFTAAGLLARRQPPPTDTIDAQIRDSGARVALHREQAITIMQEELQHSIVIMSHALRADIAGVKDRVDDLAVSVERIEKKVKENEQTK